MVFTNVRRRSVTSLLVINLRLHTGTLNLRLKQIIVSNRKELVVNTTRLLYVKVLKLVQLTAYFSLRFHFIYVTLNPTLIGGGCISFANKICNLKYIHVIFICKATKANLHVSNFNLWNQCRLSASPPTTKIHRFNHRMHTHCIFLQIMRKPFGLRKRYQNTVVQF